MNRYLKPIFSHISGGGEPAIKWSITTMPFKLRLKKSRQYNVVSKSLFVICVELLDGSSMECTLSGESTGQECLDNVCQRLGLQQVSHHLLITEFLFFVSRCHEF